MDSTTNYSLSDISAMMNGANNNGMNWNSPMWLIWALMFGNGGFGWGNRNGAAEAASTATIDMNAKLNQLSQQISDNQATNTLNTAISGNHDYLHDMQNSINMGFAGTNSAINSAAQGNMLGQKDLQSTIQTSACGINSSILNQTNQLQSRIDQLANGTQQGFASIGYAMSEQTNALNNTINNGVQSIKDQLCQATQQDLRDKLAAASQEAQTATIISNLKSSCSCGN